MHYIAHYGPLIDFLTSPNSMTLPLSSYQKNCMISYFFSHLYRSLTCSWGRGWDCVALPTIQRTLPAHQPRRVWVASRGRSLTSASYQMTSARRFTAQVHQHHPDGEGSHRWRRRVWPGWSQLLSRVPQSEWRTCSGWSEWAWSHCGWVCEGV